MGRKKRPYYRIVAVDSRRKRDGAFIDRIGYYHPIETPVTLLIDADKALKWLRVGAIPSDTVLSLFKKEGVWLRYRLERRGLPEAQINSMMNEWFVKHGKSIVTAEAAKPVEVLVVAAPVAEAVVATAAVAVEEAVAEAVAPVKEVVAAVPVEEVVAVAKAVPAEEAVAEPVAEETKGE